MIIWGWTGREITKGSGELHCPQCESQQAFELKRIATYFTLYFIPLFETTHHGNVVKCAGCKGQFKTAVLSYKPPTPAELMLQSVREDLRSGTPVQMARTKLLNAGIDAELADQLMIVAAGESLLRCTACDLAFIEGIKRCSGCGNDL